MIQATLKSTGALIDRPIVSYITLPDENQLAVQRKNEDTGKVEQLTIGELFDIWFKKSSYKMRVGDQEETIGPEMFESWFSKKYISGTGLQNSLLSISYERI